ARSILRGIVDNALPAPYRPAKPFFYSAKHYETGRPHLAPYFVGHQITSPREDIGHRCNHQYQNPSPAGRLERLSSLFHKRNPTVMPRTHFDPVRLVSHTNPIVDNHNSGYAHPAVPPLLPGHTKGEKYRYLHK